MAWTDERVSVLTKMWGDGKTAAEIAKELGEGVTRNAVIGKAHRLETFVVVRLRYRQAKRLLKWRQAQ